MNLSSPELDAKYRRLGFTSAAFGLELQVGDVHLCVAEHPWKGAVIIFTYTAPRTMAQFDIAVPTRCSAEQIAGLIYMNIATNFREEAATWKRHFEAFDVPLFQ